MIVPHERPSTCRLALNDDSLYFNYRLRVHEYKYNIIRQKHYRLFSDRSCCRHPCETLTGQFTQSSLTQSFHDDRGQRENIFAQAATN